MSDTMKELSLIMKGHNIVFDFIMNNEELKDLTVIQKVAVLESVRGSLDAYIRVQGTVAMMGEALKKFKS
jgi:hypothetical protein